MAHSQSKPDITDCMAAAEELLEEVDDPLHRQILENYRRHILCEITGSIEETFEEDDMWVEEPKYRVYFWGESADLAGFDELADFYSGLDDTYPVVLLENEILQIHDEDDELGLFTDADYRHYLPGEVLDAMGMDVDPEGYYVRRFHMVGYWPYDERGRLKGERTGEVGEVELEKIPEEEFITLEETKEKIEPIIRPLPDPPEAAGD